MDIMNFNCVLNTSDNIHHIQPLLKTIVWTLHSKD